MRSRRAVLAGLGTAGAVGVAGCSALPFGDGGDDERTDVSLPPDAVGPITWPASPFPAAVPSALAETHQERARELLAAVPAEPSLPNAAVAEELRATRDHAADRLTSDIDDPWPVEALSEWRDRRHAAATVRGSYRAATGEDDAETVADRRRSVREGLHSFVASHEYRASSPLEAVLAHAPIEELVSDCRRRARPAVTYPDDPIERPFQAGDAVGEVEFARATLADARGLREAYRTEEPNRPPQWARLIDASDSLRISVGRTRSTVREFLDAEGSPFEADLDGTAARWLFRSARRQVDATVEEHRDRHDDGEYATAVVEAGQALAATEAFRAAIDGIRDGAYQGDVTVESVSRTAERAGEAVAAIGDHRDERLARLLARPALGTLEYLPDQIEDGYTDATRAQGELARAELYARAVPAATTFVAGRLEEPEDGDGFESRGSS
jgi:hypothetical protein